MAALSDQDDPLAPAKPLATGYAMPDYLSGPAPAKPQAAAPAPAPAAPVAKPRAATPAPAAPVDPSAAPQTHAARAQTPSAAGDASSLIAHFEGFRAVPYFDANHYRVGYGSDTVTHADGRVESVTPFTRVTPEDAQRDLQRRVGIYQQTIQQTIGPDAWARLTPQAQASITSVAYNYGYVPAHVLAAAQSGDPQKIASSIASLAGANDGVNAKRRQQEAGAVLGTFGLSGPVAAHGAVQNYAMPAGAEGAPYQAQIGQPESPATKPEEKKFDWDSIAKPEEKKYDWDSIAVADGAKKVNDEAGAEGKGFIGRTYDKLVGGLKAAGQGIISAAPALAGAAGGGQAMGDVGKPEPEDVKGLGAAFGKQVTGAAELLPNELGGGLAAEGTRYLNTVGSDEGRKLGEIAAPVALAGLLPALGGGGAAAEAAPEAAAAGGRLAQFGKSMGAGALWGGSGATGEESYGSRLIEKAPGALFGAGLGALVPAASALKGGYDTLVDKFAAAKTDAPEVAAEALGGEVVSAQKAKAAERSSAAAKADAERLTQEKEAETHEAGLARIEKARAELESREIKRAERDPLAAEDPKNPKSQTAIREAVAERTRKSVRDAEQQARDAGATVEEAKTFALKRESERLEAEQAAADIAERHADLGKNGRSGVELGKDIQETADKMYRERVARRTKESGLGAVLKEQGDRQVSTEAILKTVDEALPKLANSDAKAVLNWIKGEATSRISGVDKEGKEVTEIVNRISLDKAESLRKTLGETLRTKQLAVATGQSAKASEVAHNVRQIYKDLREASGEASPDYKEAMRKFIELSRPLDLFERKGALSGPIKSDSFSDEYDMLAGRVTANVLTKTNAGAPAVKTLLEESPALKEGLRAYFLRETNGAPTAKFLQKNEQALRGAGLYDDFEGLINERSGAKTAIETAKNAEKAAKSDVAKAESAKSALDSVVKDREKLRKVAQSTPVTEPLVPTKDVGGAKHEANALSETGRKSARPAEPKDADLRAKEADKRLKDQAAEVKPKAEKARSAAESLLEEKQKHEAAVAAHDYVAEALSERTKPGKIAGKVRQHAETMREANLISAEQAKAWVEEANKVDQLFKTREEAEKAIKKYKNFLMATGIATAAYQLGSRLGGHLFLRNVPGG